MSKKYKVVGNVTGREKGSFVTESDFTKDSNPSFDKLVRNGSIVEDGSVVEAPAQPIGAAQSQFVDRVIPAAPNDEEARAQGAATGQMNTKTDFPMPNAPAEEPKHGKKSAK